MNNVFKALYDRFVASGLASAITSLYNTEAPQDSVFPYAVMIITENTTDIDSSQYWENYVIKFDIFSKQSSSYQIGTIFEVIKATYDYFGLVVEDSNTVIMQRTNAALSKSDNVWKYEINYKLLTTNER
jgi:hypothetical protein